MNCNSTLKCRVRKSGDGYEGTVYVSGLRPTKIVKKDDTSVYAKVSGITAAARAIADRLGLTLEVEDTSTNSRKRATPSTETVSSDMF